MNFVRIFRGSALTLSQFSTSQRLTSVIYRFTHSRRTDVAFNSGNQLTEPLDKSVKTQNENDPDIFGTLATNSPNYSVFSTLGANPDELDDKDGEEEYQAKIADVGRPRPFDYLIKMEKLLNVGVKDVKKKGAARLQEALTLLDVDMKKECVRPKSEHYRILIHACGRIGYFEKAFRLYKEHCERGYSPNFGIYADLFNSCANSPPFHLDQALARASNLRNKMSVQYKSLPKPVYHTMIKAFGRCGDLESAFGILDQMRENKLLVNAETINHLLHGCISDKDAGFRHALIVWRRMRNKKITPNVQSYNLIIRSAKECNAGLMEAFPDLILETITSGKDLKDFKNKLIEVEGAQPKQEQEAADKKDGILVMVEEKDKLLLLTQGVPNFLAPHPNMKDIYGIADLSTPQVRFQLLGGVKGLIKVATKIDKISPDIKTFSQMLSCIEESIEAEEDLLNEIRRLKVATDVDFFNQLISRRAKRADRKKGQEVLQILSSEFGHTPDIMTFGVLAMCCDSLKASFELINQMKDRGFSPNVEIMNTLIFRAAKRHRPRDVVLMLKEFQKLQLRAQVKTLHILEDFYKDFQQQVVAVEKEDYRKKIKLQIVLEVEQGLPNWKEFLQFYKDWLKRTQMEVPEHPWKQYLTEKDIKLGESGKSFSRYII